MTDKETIDSLWTNMIGMFLILKGQFKSDELKLTLDFHRPISYPIGNESLTQGKVSLYNLEGVFQETADFSIQARTEGYFLILGNNQLKFDTLTIQMSKYFPDTLTTENLNGQKVLLKAL